MNSVATVACCISPQLSVCLYPSTPICLQIHYTVLVTGFDRACKTMFHAPDALHFVFASTTICLCQSFHADLSVSTMRYLLLVPNVPVEHISYLLLSQHILKIAAAGSSTPAHCFAFTMERLFSPCTRYHDSQDRLGDCNYQLKLDVSTEELLSAERAFTYADVYAMLGNEDTVAWLTPTQLSFAQMEECLLPSPICTTIITDCDSMSTAKRFLPWLAPQRRL
jgi:hypothetical protein